MNTKPESKAAPAIEVKDAAEWETLMAAVEAQTPKQKVHKAFEALEVLGFITCLIPEPEKGKDKRTQDQYVQDVSVFLSKKGLDASKKMVRKHPSDATKIVVRRLA